MRDPGMPFRRHLGCMVPVLGKVYPSLSAGDFFFRVVILEISVAKLVHADESPGLGVADIIQLPPPSSNPLAVHVSDIPLQRNHEGGGCTRMFV